MRTATAWTVVLMMALVITAQAKDSKMNSATEKAVAALEQKWVEGSKASNPDMIAPLLADGFLNTGSDGKMIGRAESLAHAKAAKWETSQNSDVKVTLFGNTAIATGEWMGKGTDQDGKAVETRERWTDTWVNMGGGKWQCVASQSSTVKM
ncbi:MAG: nuclear transport factor 2 family protein [Acidobacteriales bacterium]|nr:nuclear transport factor 2 family protein [Terriglobales bacterium]